MKPKFLLSALLVLSLMNAGCVHTSSVDDKTVSPTPTNSPLREQKVQDLVIRSLLYVPTKFPLEDFFTRLERGDFKKAFNKIDLNYKSSNINDEALTELVDHGFIPAYVEIENRGQTPVMFDATDVLLLNGSDRASGLCSSSVPHQFKKFSAEALAANTYNATVVVVSFAALIVGMAAAMSHCNGCDITPFAGFPGTSSHSDTRVFNDMTKTTRLNYQSYLLPARELAPGESAKGLVIFRLAKTAGLHEGELTIDTSKSKTAACD